MDNDVNKYIMSSSIFVPIIDELVNQDVKIFGPTSLQEYVKERGFGKVNAPSIISIDSLDRLHSSLKQNDSMVFRLGRSEGTGTLFAVIMIKNRLNDFFLIDQEIFNDDGNIFEPKVNVNQLLAYKLLPTLTETSLVNLGFSSGLISYALNLDEVEPLFPPATCSSTFSFSFKPHSLINREVFHNQGQVEIDSMFVMQRGGLFLKQRVDPLINHWQSTS